MNTSTTQSQANLGATTSQFPDQTTPTGPAVAETAVASSDTSQARNIRDPMILVTKGRKRKHAFQNPLNLGAKEI
jgi:hypothetical protein